MQGGSIGRLGANCIRHHSYCYSLRSNIQTGIRRGFPSHPTLRYASSRPTGPASPKNNGSSQDTHTGRAGLWDWLSKNIRKIVLATLVLDASYALAVYTTGGLDDSPISPYNDSTTSPYLRWIFPRPIKEPLHPNEFRKFILIGKERVSETSSILTLQPAQLGDGGKKNADPYAAFWAQGIWSVEIKQPQLQIARRYTPLPPPQAPVADLPSTTAQTSSDTTTPTPDNQDQNQNQNQNLTLLIRLSPTGELSRYLSALPLGSPLEIRGGYPEYPLPKDISEVLFLAGGTGIAPALQVAHTLAWRYVHKDHDGVGMRILWASRYKEECAGATEAVEEPRQTAVRIAKSPSPATETSPPNVLVQRLNALEESGTCLRLSTTCYIDETGTFLTPANILDALTTLSASPGETATRAQGRKLILISGPEGFEEWLAGPRRRWRGGEVVGVTGGVLAGMDLGGWEVRRL